MSGEKNGLVGIISFLSGAAIGAALALLFAPQSGVETRKKIKDVSDKVGDEIKENYEKVSKETKKAIDLVKNTAEKGLENLKHFVEGTKVSLKHEIKEEMKDDDEEFVTKKKAGVKA